MSATHQNEQRLLLIEKVLLLKSLSLFEETPETVLAELAEILEEEEFEKGKAIFSAGDEAHCMYIIFNINSYMYIEPKDIDSITSNTLLVIAQKYLNISTATEKHFSQSM